MPPIPEDAIPEHAKPDASLAPAYAALVAGAIAMGISPVFVRLADVGPFTSAFWRVALALPVLYAWMRLERRAGEARPDVEGGQRFSRAAIYCGLAFAGDLLVWHVAITKTTIANATFFATTAPLWVVVVGFVAFRVRVTRDVLVGLALCLAGGAALVGHSFEVAPARVAGDLYGVATGFFFGLYFLAVTAARKVARAGQVTFELTCVTAAILLAAALLFETRFWPQSGAGWAALLGMALISHVGGQGLLSIALGRLPAVFSSLVIFLEAVAAALFGWLILDEALSLAQGIGGLVILAGIFVARPREALHDGV